MTITEPMTLATDYLLGAFTFFFAARLWVSGRGGAVRLWAGAFFASSAAAFLGGTYHGFVHHLGPLVSGVLWKLTVYAVGIASFSLLASAAFSILEGAGRRVLLALAALKFVIYGAWMVTHDAFRYVLYDYAPALVAVLLLHLWSGVRLRHPAAPWIIAGILVSFAAAAIQAARLAPHPQFNHNDLYHVIQIGAFWLLYRGGLRLEDGSFSA